MLFGCKNAETGIFLDISYKIYQNGNYKREVIEMVTRMEYLQKSENRPDFRPFFFRKLRWYPGRQCDGLVIRLILIYYILAKRLLPYIFCKITAFLHSKSLTLYFSKEISR